jgi:tetratricopeptide (TPR) repeat protein
MLAYESALKSLKEGAQERAQKELEKAVALDPSLAEAHFELGRLGMQRANRGEALDLAELERAIAAFARAVELAPENEGYVLQLGRACFQKDDLESARKHIARAVELDPRLVGGWKLLAQIQLDQGEAEGARDSLRKAIEVNARDASAHFLLAQALERLNELEGARKACEQSIQLDPSSYEVHARLAQLCNKLGDVEGETKAKAGMERWYEFDQRMKRRLRAVENDPTDGVAARRLGETYMEVGDWERAREMFVRAARIDGRDWRAHLSCGVACRNLKDYVYATHHLKEAEFLAPDVLDPKLELLRLHGERKDEASLAELIRSIEVEAAGDGNSLWFVAEVLEEVGRADDARRLFEKAKALGVSAAPTEFETAEEEPEAK